MPSIGAHMVVAKEVAQKLHIQSDEFIKGNLLPDILDEVDSHHKMKSGIYLVPNIDAYLNHLDFCSEISIGYLTHLLLDKHYLEDYIAKKYPKKNVFLDGKIYQDYDIINSLLVDKFQLNVPKIEEILKRYDCKIVEEKLKYNIECLKQKKFGYPLYLNFEDFSRFLKDVSETIRKELVDYANKSYRLCVCLRQYQK